MMFQHPNIVQEPAEMMTINIIAKTEIKINSHMYTISMAQQKDRISIMDPAISLIAKEFFANVMCSAIILIMMLQKEKMNKIQLEIFFS